MPSYKLTYFNGRGRAECCRLLFAAAGVKYEDNRLQGEEWAKLKASSKFGALPELEIDGKKYGQSRAIMFYLARELGFYPSSHLEQLVVDETVFVLEDLINALVKAMFAKEEEKEQKIKEFKEEILDKHLTNLEKIASINGSNGFMTGKKVTVADIAAFDSLSGLSVRFEGCLEKYPGLKKVVDSVKAIGGIKKWVETRPETQF